MSIEKIRKDFELACKRHAFDSGFEEYEHGFNRSNEDQSCYSDSHTQAGWWAWQESVKNTKEGMASFLVNQLSLSRGRPVEWCEAVIITAVLTGMDDIENSDF